MTEPGRLFVPINKGGRLLPRLMSAQAIYDALRKRGRGAGVRDFSPHDCRRSFAGPLLEVGADIATVERLMGPRERDHDRQLRRPGRADEDQGRLAD